MKRTYRGSNSLFEMNSDGGRVLMDERRLYELKHMPYEEYLKTPEWAEKRELVLERDGHRCMLCNTRENLHVHHRTYARRGYEELEDLVTLCKEDHEHFHQRMRTSDAMSWDRRYTPPRDEKSQEQKMKDDRRQWEDYLLGLLILNPGLCLHVCGIISERDFASEDTRSLYSLLNSTYQRDHSIINPFSDQLIPDELQEAANRARSRADSKTPKDGEGLIKEAVQACIRLKRMALIQLSTEIKYQIQAAAEAEDKQLYRELTQEFLALRQQRQVLDAATHLQG